MASLPFPKSGADRAFVESGRRYRYRLLPQRPPHASGANASVGPSLLSEQCRGPARFRNNVGDEASCYRHERRRRHPLAFGAKAGVVRPSRLRIAICGQPGAGIPIPGFQGFPYCKWFWKWVQVENKIPAMTPKFRPPRRRPARSRRFRRRRSVLRWPNRHYAKLCHA